MAKTLTLTPDSLSPPPDIEVSKEKPSVRPVYVPDYDYEPLDLEAVNSGIAPFNGSMVIISDDETKPGIIAVWKNTRRREGVRWVPFSGWIDPLTKMPITFEPICWRVHPDWNALS